MLSVKSSPRLLLAAIVCSVLMASSGSLGVLAAAEPNTAVYSKKETWTETVLAARAGAIQLRSEAVQRSSPAGAKPFDSGTVRGGAEPVHVSVDVTGCRWLWLSTVQEESMGNCHIWGEARLIAQDGREVKLSSLTPSLVRVGWGELLKDRNWQNHPLKVGTRQFEHGIWVHANSDVGYRLDGKYKRFEAWAGLDADRPQGAARFQVGFQAYDPVPDIWRRLKADFPIQSGWLTRDIGRSRELHWLADTPMTGHLDWPIRKAAGEAGPHGAVVAQGLEALRRAKPPAEEGKWLDLYALTCRIRDGEESLRSIWLTDLRRSIEACYEEIFQATASPDDPRWQHLHELVQSVANQLPPGSPIDAGSMRASIEALAKALPGRFEGAPLLAKLDQRQPCWHPIIAAASQGESQAIAQLGTLAEEVKSLRHELLTGLAGMPEFLSQPAQVAMETEWEDQYRALEGDLGNRPHFERVAPETYRREALVLDSDRDPVDVVLRRTAALLADLRSMGATGLEDSAEQLASIQEAAAQVDPSLGEARFVLFADACRIRRRIALANPLIDFDKLLFVKHHRALFNHMCDQYYGMAATPGGGLYVLSDAFGPSPKLRDVLAGSVVEKGRLKGRELSGGPTTPPDLRFDGQGNLSGPECEGGSFLSPDLSYDGKQVVFAFVECRGDPLHQHHTDPTRGHWDAGRCYHIFKVRVDGSGLEQLTDSTWNDFDPCWLPNGRIAFISERRGGYLRCGRVCPTYTLFDMAADGSNIACLSFHETNEWHPSVTHDGLILWTRWDYVDRHGCTAHMPWVTGLDGRDPRPVHGNYSPRGTRPDMELDCRAIPGSRKLIATAAPHHGQAYGSLILIDPQTPDDDGMGPIRRITPEVGFPESQGGSQVYGTAWPLSEDYYLCVYDASMQPNAGRQGGAYARGNYAIYLVDAFGNKELIYRDPEIACLSPIPVRPRPMPLAVPELVARGPETNPATRPAMPAEQKPEGTIAVVNVYDSIKPWPEGTKITELRVFQVLPMSVPSGRPPHETGIRIASAGDSVVPCRNVLGTVPVEEDGSAHFTVPANVELFFQALDQKGLAVQSMRSATALQKGERLLCAGCHEPKHHSRLVSSSLPLAFRREPSQLVPDVDGSNPFSYPRLVQPVLDKHCVDCHREHADEAPNLAREPIVRNWYASYNSLVAKYGFYDYGDPYRTTPGQFGARASTLYKLLKDGHHDVKLTEEELHRLTLWLDSASMFYGVYEKEGGEAQLRGEIARPMLE